jgi:cell division protein FtsB
MKKAALLVFVFCFIVGMAFLYGCGPSTKELLEQKTKENQELTNKVADLEKQVKTLQDELAGCQEDFKNLLYFNREKGTK